MKETQPTTATPVRLQRTRAFGFDLQMTSQETNGLPAVYVGRPGKWGNPYKVGDIVHGCINVADNRHAAKLYGGHAPLNPALVTAAREEIRGKNLACWCGLCARHQKTGLPLGENCPDCEPCHADVLLAIANKVTA